MSKKIILANKKEINIMDITEACFVSKLTIQQAVDLYEELTEDNLARIEIIENDNTLKILENKCRSSLNYDGEYATFYFNSIDVNAKKIKALEETIDALVLSNMGIE